MIVCGKSFKQNGGGVINVKGWLELRVSHVASQVAQW